MPIPPDFTRRVQENPQIAEFMLRVQANPQIAVELLTALRYARRFLKPHDVDTGYIDNVIADATLPSARDHYRNELALDAAARTGEEPLDEHIRCVPGME